MTTSNSSKTPPLRDGKSKRTILKFNVVHHDFEPWQLLFVVHDFYLYYWRLTP